MSIIGGVCTQRPLLELLPQNHPENPHHRNPPIQGLLSNLQRSRCRGSASSPLQRAACLLPKTVLLSWGPAALHGLPAPESLLFTQLTSHLRRSTMMIKVPVIMAVRYSRFSWTFPDLADFLPGASPLPLARPHFCIHVCPDFSGLSGLFQN